MAGLFPSSTTYPGSDAYPLSGDSVALGTQVETETALALTVVGSVELPLEVSTTHPGPDTYPGSDIYPTTTGPVESEVVLELTVVGVIELPTIVEIETVPVVLYQLVLPVVIEYEYGPPVRLPRLTHSIGPLRYQGMRVIAQNLSDGAFLDWELPVADLSITATLSGPQAITGNLRPVLPRVAEENLTPWTTYLHVEDSDGFIRGSAILTAPFGVSDDQRAIESTGVSTHAHGAPFLDYYSSYSVDPLDVVRTIWTHVQSRPGSNLGVIVSPTTSNVRVGGYPPLESTGLVGPRADDSSSSDTEAKPYELAWWDQKNCGEEIDSLAQSVPFDYLERQEWSPDKTFVNHYIDLGWPRIGRKRTDLRFADGENVIGSVAVNELDDSYVTEVIVTGAGDGAAKVIGGAARRAAQLRRVVTIDEKSVKSVARANAIAQAELLRRTEPRGIETLLVDARHVNAPFGSYTVGDDIFVQVEVDWVGEIAMWHRIVEYTYTPDEEAVALKLRPSDSFRYGASV
ncbi:MAG: hypothetical protein ACOYB2_19520 [Limnohabitans sp.]